MSYPSQASFSPAQEQNDTRRYQGDAADGSTAAHRWQLQSPPPGAWLSRSRRRSRRVGRCGPCTRPSVDWPLARARAPRSAALQPHLLPPPRGGLPWPLARPPGSHQQPLPGCGACPCECGRPASAAGDGARWGRHVEKSSCSFRAHDDRAIGGTLDLGDVGTVWSSGGGPRARMTAQERSEGSRTNWTEELPFCPGCCE
mmetsp:Transcript_44634/g.131760  ORF Transcript_44634/g.131760 Transcript_44634/m.131760 type:complete len:200 (-) Transcript_44634:42-641(-)